MEVPTTREGRKKKKQKEKPQPMSLEQFKQLPPDRPVGSDDSEGITDLMFSCKNKKKYFSMGIIIIMCKKGFFFICLIGYVCAVLDKVCVNQNIRCLCYLVIDDNLFSCDYILFYLFSYVPFIELFMVYVYCDVHSPGL